MPDAEGPPRSAEPFSDRARELNGHQAGTEERDDEDPDDAADRHEVVVALLRRGLAAGEWSAPGLLASVHLEHGERLEAAEVLGPAVMSGGHVDLAGTLGNTLSAIGDHDGAEAAFLVGVDAGDAGAINDYGVYLRDRGRTQEAIYVLDRAAREGDDLAPLNLVSLHLEELDDMVAATEVAERYHDESRPATLVALADVRLAAGRVDDAEALYVRAVELRAACAHIYYGWFLQDRRGDVAGAEDHLRRAHEAGEAGAAYHLGRFLHDSGRMDEAASWLEEASAAGDEDAEELLEAEYRGLVDQYDD